MTRAQIAAPPLPKGSTEVKIIERSWGMKGAT